jgi:hypothetical protein
MTSTRSWRHCEEQGDEAISQPPDWLCFPRHPHFRPKNGANWVCLAFCPHQGLATRAPVSRISNLVSRIPNRQSAIPNGGRLGRPDWLCFSQPPAFLARKRGKLGLFGAQGAPFALELVHQTRRATGPCSDERAGDSGVLTRDRSHLSVSLSRRRQRVYTLPPADRRPFMIRRPASHWRPPRRLVRRYLDNKLSRQFCQLKNAGPNRRVSLKMSRQ